LRRKRFGRAEKKQKEGGRDFKQLCQPGQHVEDMSERATCGKKNTRARSKRPVVSGTLGGGKGKKGALNRAGEKKKELSVSLKYLAKSRSGNFCVGEHD